MAAKVKAYGAGMDGGVHASGSLRTQGLSVECGPAKDKGMAMEAVEI